MGVRRRGGGRKGWRLLLSPHESLREERRNSVSMVTTLIGMSTSVNPLQELSLYLRLHLIMKFREAV